MLVPLHVAQDDVSKIMLLPIRVPDNDNFFDVGDIRKVFLFFLLRRLHQTANIRIG